MIHHISLFLCKSAEPIPCVFSSFSKSFSSVLSQQQEHIATRLHCPCFSVERINSYELILYNGQESNRCLRQKFLRQKIDSSQIKVCRFQWTPSLRNYFQKQSPIAFPQKCVLQICSKFTGGDPYGRAISKSVA